MNKKILITIGILILLISSVFIVMKIREKPEFGACETDADCKLVRCVGAYCDNGKCVCPMGGVKKLSDVKVAIIYQYIMDGIFPERSIEDISKILNETKTDFIIRAAFKWYAMPESFYEKFGEAVKEIKVNNPDIIICGSFGAQFVDKKREYDPIKKKILNKVEVEEMALDLSKHSEWGLNETQIESFWEIAQIPEYGTGYLPDITNQKFQELSVNIAKRQIDAGADAIWIDGLYLQARFLGQVFQDPNHIAVKESFEGSSKIVNEIYDYAKEKKTKVYIGTWIDVAFFPFALPKFDFLTFTPSKDEVLTGVFNKGLWDLVKSKVEEKFGDIPIFVYIDYGMHDDSPLATFSQKLTSKKQSEFLMEIDEFASSAGMIFTYPVHGFFMGQNAKILSYNKYNWYDSLAPEFQTYETIKELALKKK